MKIALGVAIAALLGASTPGLSQTSAVAPERSFEAMIYDFGVCMVRRHHKDTRHMLLSDDLWEHLDGKIILEHPVECDRSFDNSSEVSFIKDLYVYSVAIALVQIEFSKSGPDDFSTIGPLSQPAVAEARLTQSAHLTKAQKTLRQWRAHYSRIAECIVRAAPDATRQWLVARYESAEDSSAATALTPVFESCRAKLGFSDRFDVEQVKGAVAVNYFRLAHAEREQSGGVAK